MGHKYIIKSLEVGVDLGNNCGVRKIDKSTWLFTNGKIKDLGTEEIRGRANIILDELLENSRTGNSDIKNI